MNNSKIGLRKWASFILAGIVGQLAWAIPVSIVVIALGILTPFAIKLWNKVRDRKAAA